jgi:HEAT repeat protein
VNEANHLDALLERIRTSTDWEDRENAIHDLIILDSKDERIVPLMGQVLRDLEEHGEELVEDPEIDLESIQEAIESVVLGFGEAALPQLRELSKDGDPIMRSNAVWLLANMAMAHQISAPIPDLIAMLEVESDSHVQHMLTTTGNDRHT